MASPDLSKVAELLEIMARLRTPDGGCPWDLEQTFETIAPYTIEEAYEVEDAIARRDMEGLKDELGDLLLQVVFHARMAEEAGLFSFADVAAGIADKMIRRHPHVFGDASADHAAEVSQSWEAIKAEERRARKHDQATGSEILSGVAAGLPGMTRAVKLQNRAARVGFDWPDIRPVFSKIKEELKELEDEIESGNSASVAEEYGDVLFVVANLARHLKLDPEERIRAANRKFIRRFNRMEEILNKRGKDIADCDLATMDSAWNEAKAEEKAGPA